MNMNYKLYPKKMRYLRYQKHKLYAQIVVLTINTIHMIQLNIKRTLDDRDSVDTSIRCIIAIYTYN